MPETGNEPQINAEPTKAFFVEMLTRDIALEQAVLDLVDNSVDGAKSMKGDGPLPFEGRKVEIELGKEKFRIIDNCGGFSKETARTYAFRFGRPSNAPRTPHSIGQFGVGMKRALFKFGSHFKVRSASVQDSWAVEVNVSEWENQTGWNFPWAEFQPDGVITKDVPGTEIVVSRLRPEVAGRFSTKLFENTIIGLLKAKHRQFIAEGLSISVNGQHINASSLYLLVKEDSKFNPGTDEYTIENQGEKSVKVRIVVGVGYSSPREAGWYVICNGRVVLESDRRNVTGWGVLEEETNSLLVPSFHNQYGRFRGIVSFDSDDSARVPWNTTKTDVDQDHAVWQVTSGRMIEMMRPVINFLNDLDTDIEEHTKEKSPLLEYVSKAKAVKLEELPARRSFSAPARGSIVKGPKNVKVQYSKPLNEIEFLMKEMSLSSATAVGQRTFELIYKRMGGE